MPRLIFARLPGRQQHHHIAVTRLRARQATSLHTHDFPEFFLVTHGRGTHRWNGRDRALARGSFAFVRATDEHCYVAGAEDGLEFVNVALAPAWWNSFRTLFAPPLFPTTNVTTKTERVLDAATTTRLAVQLHALLERGAVDQALLVETATALARASLGPALPAAPGADRAVPLPEWLARVARDMRDPALVARPLAFWQRHSGRSAEHLARSCRRFLGMPLSELLNHARIEWVKIQLSRGEDKITRIAFEAGYQNLGYFYRVFRRLEKCTPRQWLQRHGGAATVPR